MDLKTLRKIAKSNRFQSLYRRAKESGMVRLFVNDCDLSKIQEWFLHYLEIYNLLYKDLANKEPYITEEVIQNDIRADSYLFFKSKQKDNKKKNRREVTTSGDIPSMVFRRKEQGSKK